MTLLIGSCEYKYVTCLKKRTCKNMIRNCCKFTSGQLEPDSKWSKKNQSMWEVPLGLQRTESKPVAPSLMKSAREN
jgi:hypothetical protein